MRRLLHIPLVTTMLIWTLVVTTFCIGWWTPEGWAMLAPAVSTAAEQVRDTTRADLPNIQRVPESPITQQLREDSSPAPTSEEMEEITARLPSLSGPSPDGESK